MSGTGIRYGAAMSGVRREVDSPVGVLRLVAVPEGLALVTWGADTGRHRAIWEAASPEGPESGVLDSTVTQLEEYFAGRRRAFDLPLAPEGTEFQRAAWQALRSIDYATTISYAEQARRMGRPTATRAVGAANGRNPIAIVVPCHRVIGADGSLTGFGGGIDTKRWLLDLEQRQSA